MPRLSVQQLFDGRRERLGLEWAAGMAGSDRLFTGAMLHKPGVGLIGHLNLIHPLLAQVMGPREVDYLDKLDPQLREQRMDEVQVPDEAHAGLVHHLAGELALGARGARRPGEAQARAPVVKQPLNAEAGHRATIR